MSKILVLGAGQSAPFMIRYLLDHAEAEDWYVTVADRDFALAQSRITDGPRGHAVELDMADTLMVSTEIGQADVVVNFLPPRFQASIGRTCVEAGTHMVSASYRSQSLRDLDAAARRQGVLLLSEMGLDPGIDVMSAMALVDRIRRNGGVVESFESYGAGLPAPHPELNPLRYAITWNPRNVVMAGEEGAQYLIEGRVKILPWHQVFARSWHVDVNGIGQMEAYPNRDSLSYRDTFGLENAHTMIRGTIRYPGWCETWSQVVKLGLPNEHLRIPDLPGVSFRHLVEMFLPRSTAGSTVEERLANFLGINPTGRIMQNLEWLGLFSDEPCGAGGQTIADALVHLLRSKLVLPPGGRDMAIVHHILQVRYPAEDGRRERITADLTEYGEPGGETAMARCVGLPAAVAVKLLLAGKLPLTGAHIPTHPWIYSPVLEQLEREGMSFTDTAHTL